LFLLPSIGIKNILIPTDFSENSWNAIKYAVSFFNGIPVSFYLLHVSLVEEVDEDACFYKYSDTIVDKKILYNPSEVLQAELIKAKKYDTSNKHQFYAIHEYVQFIEAIRKSVVEKNIDYIVMGTKGASQYNNSTLGSHTGSVITKVKCPILVVPEKAVYTAPSTVLLPTDFNLNFKNKVLNTIDDILKVKKATLSVLYISKSVKELSPLQKRNREVLQESLQDKIKSCYFISDQNIENAVDTFVKSKKVDMIAMVAKNLNFFQKILFKPTVEKISYHIEIPFLVLHE
jgi:nucleotide-binding universal stress UspA family protein